MFLSSSVLKLGSAARSSEARAGNKWLKSCSQGTCASHLCFRKILKVAAALQAQGIQPSAKMTDDHLPPAAQPTQSAQPSAKTVDQDC
jgi:hypothetical protein